VQIFWEKGNPVKVVNLTTKEEATSPANVLKLLNRLGGLVCLSLARLLLGFWGWWWWWLEGG